MDEVILDFGPDPESNIKSFVVAGSFYVAMTRVRIGKDLYLKSFDVSYIQVNPKVEEKVNAMIDHRQYKFKKIYLSDEVFKTHK